MSIPAEMPQQVTTPPSSIHQLDLFKSLREVVDKISFVFQPH
jgi:hypothetical protein